MSEIEGLVPALPLPLAQLLRRALRSYSALEMHHNAYYLAEATLKLVAATRVGLWMDRSLEPGSSIAGLLESLVLPSLGQWRDSLRDVERSLGGHPGLSSLPLGCEVGTLTEARPEWKSVSRFAAHAVESGAVSDQVGEAATQDGVLGFFSLVVAYRNRVMAHGAQRLPEFYEQAGPLLLQALLDVLRCPQLLGDGRLAYARLRVDSSTSIPSLYWQTLHGPVSQPLGVAEPLPGPTSGVAGHVCLVSPRGLVPLHPLVVYQIDEVGREAFGFLNRTIRKPRPELQAEEVRRADYLDYCTGENLVGVDTRASLTAWLGRLRGAPTTPEDLKAAQTASLKQVGADIESVVAPKGVVIGDFEILSEIGRGGMGVVYRVRQCSLNRLVALKVLPPLLAGDATTLRRFRREMAALARCDHPNIVQIITSGADSEHCYYAMELVDGVELGRVSRVLQSWRLRGITLCEAHWQAALEAVAKARGASGGSDQGDELRKCEPPTIAADKAGRSMFTVVAHLFADVAFGLDHMHQRGIQHRDIKPSNLLLSSDGRRIVITDLGLARLRDSSQGTSHGDARILGTLRYAAPELLIGPQCRVDYRADLYALGASLYELVTGRPMFDGQSESRLVHQILHEEPRSPRQSDRQIPSELAAIVSVATAKDPSKRYASALAMAEDLRALADGRRVSVGGLWADWPTVRSVCRRPLAATMVGVLAAAVSVVSAVAWQWNRTTTRVCGAVVRRWETMECVNPVADQDQPRRGVSYRLYHRRGTVFRVERVNGLGQLVADDQGEARWEMSLSSAARVAAHDTRGMLLHKLSYSSDLSRMERKDARDNPKTEEGSEVCVYQLELDNRGVRRQVRFRNIYGHPIASRDGSYGHRYQTDGLGRVTAIEYLGEDDRPTQNRLGVWQETVRYDDAGNEVERRYWSHGESAAIDRNGVSGFRQRYDDYGNPVELVWLDTESKPTVHAQGMAGWIAEYDNHGNRTRETYRDPRGDPAWHADGHAGWVARYDLLGNLVQKTYLDDQAAHTAIRTGCSGWAGQYSRTGDLVEELCLDGDGRPTTNREGFASRRIEFADGRRKTGEVYLDAQGQPTKIRDGYASWRAEHDPWGNQIRLALYGTKAEPVVGKYGHAGWVAEYDERGNQVQITYLGADSRPAATVHGYAIVRTLYNSIGKIIESSFLDSTGQPVRTTDGYAVVRRGYDRQGEVVEESYWDPGGRPVLHRQGYFIVRMRNDDHGNRIEEAYFGLTGDLIVTRDGVAQWRATRDSKGRETETTYYDAAGRIAPNVRGFARRAVVYDDRGNVVQESYWDAEGRPTRTTDGYWCWQGVYDHRGNMVEQRFLGQDGQLVPSRKGYALKRVLYDFRGYPTEIRYFSEDGRPAILSTGHSTRQLQHDYLGRITSDRFLGASDLPVLIENRFAGRRFVYDDHDRPMEVEFLDAGGNPVEPVDARWVDGQAIRDDGLEDP